jgi:hypothetical protein
MDSIIASLTQVGVEEVCQEPLDCLGCGTCSKLNHYVLITYNGEEIDKSGCFHFSSEHQDLELDPYGDKVPFAVGSNQAIFKIEDAPYIPERTVENTITGVTNSNG